MTLKQMNKNLIMILASQWKTVVDNFKVQVHKSMAAKDPSLCLTLCRLCRHTHGAGSLISNETVPSVPIKHVFSAVNDPKHQKPLSAKPTISTENTKHRPIFSLLVR